MTTKTVTLKNGFSFEAMNVYGGRARVQGADRDCLEIKVAEEAEEYDDLKAAYLDPAALSEITITETHIDDETGEETADQYLHLNYTIPVDLSLRSFDDGSRAYMIKIAKKTDLEIAVEELAKRNEETELALMELAGMI